MRKMNSNKAILNPPELNQLLSNNRQSGFTLIEIIVAVSILAIASTAINSALVKHADTAAHLEERLVANWVASNAIAEARLAFQYEESPKTSGSEDMGGREWRFALEESNTSDQYLRKVEAQVFLEGDSKSIIRMDGYYSSLLKK